MKQIVSELHHGLSELLAWCAVAFFIGAATYFGLVFASLIHSGIRGWFTIRFLKMCREEFEASCDDSYLEDFPTVGDSSPLKGSSEAPVDSGDTNSPLCGAGSASSVEMPQAGPSIAEGSGFPFPTFAGHPDRETHRSKARSVCDESGES